MYCLTLYLIEMPFNAFANIADLDQGLLSLLINGNMIRYDRTLVDVTSNFFVLCTNMNIYIIIHSGWSLA